MLTRLSKMTTQGKLLLLSGVFAFGMIAFGTIALWTLSTVKVLGPHYQRVVLNKDLLADVLPPPNYIVETYLTAHLMPDVSDREERQKLLEQYDRRSVISIATEFLAGVVKSFVGRAPAEALAGAVV